MVLQVEQVRKLLEPQVGALAKSDGTPLWSHHYTAWWIMRCLCEYLPSLDENEREGLELAALLHDVGKMRPEVQNYLRYPTPSGPPHKPTHEEIFEAIRRSELWDQKRSAKLADFIHAITVGHHYLADQDIREMNLESADSLVRLLITVDHLASMTQIDGQTVYYINNHYPFFDLSVVEISRFPSPTGFLLQQQVREAYEKKDWRLLLAFADGQIFIGKPGNPLPNKSEIVENSHDVFLEQILCLQKPNPANFTNAMITGPALDYPVRFFEVYKERILENLKNTETAPFWFFKPIIDLINNTAFVEEWNEQFYVLKILKSSGSTASLTRAKQEWAKRSGMPIPDKQGHLQQLFERVTLKEIVPEHLRAEVRDHVALKDLYPDELLQVLHAVFTCDEVTETRPPDTIPDQIDELLNMIEERNFENFALERFERYQSYKRTANYEKGLCERCGSPKAQPVKPALNYPSDVKTKVFTQIKPSAQKETATCMLCVYDNSILREGIRGNYSPVFIRLHCLYPRNPEEIWNLTEFIEEVWMGINYPWKMEHKGEGLLLPCNLSIPVPSEKIKLRDNRFQFLPYESHPTMLMGKLELSPREGPKELKAKYAPLYHLLRLLGYETHIGMEEQVGLLGERILTTLEAYQQSLAVVVLAKAMSMKSKPFTTAVNLIEGNLSVAITMVAEDKYMREELQQTFFYSLQNRPLIKGKENWTVKDLLQDAAFLADREKGIWFFCVEHEEKSGEISKHLATKPIAQAMNILLRNRNPDEALPLAIATFDSHLRRNIPKERSEELEHFARGAHEILIRYAQLRKENFQQFLKVRNALMSAIFTYTRYPQLSKEIQK
jgi:hypothetical protein